MNIEICVPPSSTPKDRGDLLEVLSKEMLEIQNYHVEEEVRKDGSELDLLCTHNISKKRIYVECKAFRDKKIDGPIIRQLIGTVAIGKYYEGWLISTSDFTKDAKGLVDQLEKDESQILFYTPSRVLDSLIKSKTISALPQLHLENFIDVEQIGEWILLVTPFGTFWAVTVLKGGIPSNVICYYARTGKLVEEQELLDNIALTDSSLSKLDFSKIISTIEVVEVQRGDDWNDYRPARPQDFVGRTKDINAIRNQNNNFLFTFIDLFAGIGGIRMPFQQLGGKCVFSSEWDKFAQITYAANYGEVPSGDITQISAKDIPDHDILMGGFPCQAFSQAGLKEGFQDTRGTMFFEIQRILCETKPKIFLLENVKQLKDHDKGNTLKTIINILTGESDQALDDVPMSQNAREVLGKKLNYWVDFKILRAADFGIPQRRERIFIVGFDKDYFGENFDFEKIFKWPTPSYEQTRVGGILESQEVLDAQEDKYTISDKLWAAYQRRKEEYRFGYSVYTADSAYTNTISARYYKDGSEILIDQSRLGKNPRKLTPRECARLQGFPDNFIVDAVSQAQIYRQFGNSACVRVIQAIAKQLVDVLDYKRAEK
jgi:DNA (cytosine-5)-methyltransferase 1